MGGKIDLMLNIHYQKKLFFDRLIEELENYCRDSEYIESCVQDFKEASKNKGLGSTLQLVLLIQELFEYENNDELRSDRFEELISIDSVLLNKIWLSRFID